MQIQMTLYILRLNETHTLKLYALPFLATPPHPPYTLTLQAPPKPALTEWNIYAILKLHSDPNATQHTFTKITSP